MPRSGQTLRYPPRVRCFGASPVCVVLALLSLGLLICACDRNVEPFVPGEQVVTPDLSKIFPAPEESEQASSAGSAGMPASGVRSAQALPGPGSRSGKDGSSGEIRGTVRLAPNLGEQISIGSILFVIARRSGVQAGPPLAVRRFDAPSFPLRFEVGPEHVMIPGTTLEGELHLSARLDSDGNPMTRLPGDLQGSASELISPGAEDVAIVLDERL